MGQNVQDTMCGGGETKELSDDTNHCTLCFSSGIQLINLYCNCYLTEILPPLYSFLFLRITYLLQQFSVVAQIFIASYGVFCCGSETLIAAPRLYSASAVFVATFYLRKLHSFFQVIPFPFSFWDETAISRACISVFTWRKTIYYLVLILKKASLCCMN